MNIFLCIWYNDLEEVKECVNNGADVNAKDMYKITPLDYAIVWNSSQEIIEFLISKGAKQGEEL